MGYFIKLGLGFVSRESFLIKCFWGMYLIMVLLELIYQKNLKKLHHYYY